MVYYLMYFIIRRLFDEIVRQKYYFILNREEYTYTIHHIYHIYHILVYILIFI